MKLMIDKRYSGVGSGVPVSIVVYLRTPLHYNLYIIGDPSANWFGDQ